MAFLASDFSEVATPNCTTFDHWGKADSSPIHWLSSSCSCLRMISPVFENSRSAGTLAGMLKKSWAILIRFKTGQNFYSTTLEYLCVCTHIFLSSIARIRPFTQYSCSNGRFAKSYNKYISKVSSVLRWFSLQHCRFCSSTGGTVMLFENMSLSNVVL